MIDQVFIGLAEGANKYLQEKLKINEDKVILSSLVNPDGTVAVSGENKIVFTLINLGLEASLRNQLQPKVGVRFEKPLGLQCSFIASAYFSPSNYAESLQYLTSIITYFSNNPVFKVNDIPGLDKSITDISVKIKVLTEEELSNLWARLGTSYLPSVVYDLHLTITV
jgi:hypothetical protein